MDAIRIARSRAVFLAAVFSSLIAFSARAQNVEVLKDSSGRVLAVRPHEAPRKPAKGMPAVGGFAQSPANAPTDVSDPVLASQEFLGRHGAAFGLKNVDKELVPLRADGNKLGATVRSEQQYQGIPVLGAEVLTQVSMTGSVAGVSGQVAPWVMPDMKIVLSAEEAYAKAEALWVKQYGEKNLPTLESTALYIIAPGLLYNNPRDTSSYLTYQIEIRGSWPFTREFYYIDARNGELRFRQDGVRSINRLIYDCSANPAAGICYWNYTDASGYHHGRLEGEASWGINPKWQAYDVDLLYDHFGALHNYLATKFNRNGPNMVGGMGAGTDKGGHLSTKWTAGNVYQDEFWGAGCPYGSVFDRDMVGFCYGALIPDITAHEYMHALTRFSHYDGSGVPIGMVYSYQSGALDESQADIWGELYEIHTTGTSDWVTAGSWPMGFNRSIKDPPTSYQRSRNGDTYTSPDRFYSPYVYCGGVDQGGVHIISTVVSKAFYLMTVGGTFNGCTISSIGVDKVEQILYRAVTSYYSANESFNGAYYGINQSCADLYGADSEACKQVKAALQSVELDQPGLCADPAAWQRRTPACADKCPDDPNKTAPGTCGCGVADTDNNGNGVIDCLEVCVPGTVRSCGQSNVGRCRYGQQECTTLGQWGDCTGAVSPITEICGNGIDEDCDGQDTPCCVDSDGGNKPNSYGEVRWNGALYKDACVSLKFLTENYCSGNRRVYTSAYCPKGCMTGACVQ